MRIISSLILLISSCFICKSLSANTEQYYGEKIGSSFRVDSILIVRDDKFNTPAWSTIDTNISAHDLIIFELNDDTTYIQSVAFTCDVTLKIEYWDSTNTSFIIYKTLSIAFDPGDVKTYNARAIFAMEDAYKLKLTIQNINYVQTGWGGTLPPVFRLRAEIHIERKYLFDCQAVLDAISNVSTTKGLINIAWDEVDGAEEYDLEWTYYHDSSEVIKDYYLDTTDVYSNYNSLFKHNATRVTIVDNQYQVPNVYEAGFLFYRIRAIQYTADSIRLQTPWITEGYSEEFYTYEYKERLTGHENDLNWQFAVQFAEEGKRIPTVNYFDGSLRSRQTVVRSESIERVIVSETLYDHQGRAAIQTIPVPTEDTNAKIKFYTAFSMSNSTLEYTRDTFDIGTCDFVVPAMDSTYGAAEYFSKNNANWNSPTGAWIPAADGFPFSVTEYTPDLTGRIKRQTNVGAAFKLGSGKETKYFYGPAGQTDLDRVFGNEIGLNEHYWKTMVVDPNGSISVSYTDGSGHVVATALAGEAPSNLTELSSNTGATTVSTDLLDVAPIVGTDFLQYDYTLLVTTAGTHDFSYLLGYSNYNPDCIPIELDICLDCLYDIELEVTDLCGNATLPGDTAHLLALKNYSPGDVYNTECSGRIAHEPTSAEFSLYLDIGEYHVKSFIQVSDAGKEQYLDTLLSNDTCILTYDDFLESAIAELDFSGCNITCEDCLADLGERDSFIDNYISDLLLAGIDTIGMDTIQADSIYSELLANCDVLCDTIVTECEALYAAMIADISPGGQYAKYSIIGGVYTPASVSVLNAASTDFADDLTFEDLTYLDAYGNPDHVMVGGISITPDDLTLEQFIELFPAHPSWANSLVTLHPEYCAYEWCMENEESYDYAADMLATETYVDAEIKGYLNPLNNAPVVYDFLNYDPLFETGGVGDDYKDDMENDLEDWELSGYSAWELATISANCPDDPGSCTTDSIDQHCPGNALVGWTVFRGLYLAKRSYYTYQLIDAECGLSALNIGVDGAFASMQRRVLYYDDVMALDGGADTEAEFYAYSDTLMSEMCETNCEAMADMWMSLLGPCTDGISAGAYDSIRDGLIEVCIAGCDSVHPFGASDLLGAPVPVTPSGYTSFQDVLETVLGIAPGDTACNALLIDFPDPYTAPSTPYNEVFMGDFQDDCVCDKWNDIYTNDYVPDSSSYESFADFLSIHYESVLTEEVVDEIMAVCADANCLFTTQVVTLPAGLSCKPCIPCGQGLMEVYNDFFLVDGYPMGGFENYESTLASYLNAEYGYNLPYWEWKAFLDSCLVDSLAVVAGDTCDDFSRDFDDVLCDQALFTSLPIDTTDCYDYLMAIAEANATMMYASYVDSLENAWWAEYTAHCLESAYYQDFDVERPMNEYHYTLYYYDQAGNLVQTVPPQGVDMLDGTEQTTQATYRMDGTGSPQYPNHNLETRYYYNTLNQLIKQYTPDGDTTLFWYDRLGRIVASQNGRQRPNDQYSYTRYDALGRIIETGQLESSEDMTFAIAMDNADLLDWIDSGTPKTEVAQTYYDNAALPVDIHFVKGEQSRLRNRIASVTWELTYDGDSLTYDYASHYSYDIAGNVHSLVQELGGLRGTGNDFKRIDYEYDLISGKVNQVLYQPDSADQYFHEYLYDKDNRLATVLTSRDGYLWDYDANYLYYMHGPLRRTEIGERQVQGMDYAYTLQGWLKGMNSEGRDKDKDMGLDGKSSGSHKWFGRDAATFVLSYFNADYRPIGSARFTATFSPTAGFGASSPSLYNGNIRKATYSIENLTEQVIGYAYQYDQLNRLIGMDAWLNFSAGSYNWPGSGSASNKYKERVTYDANGNILTYIRHGGSPAPMDSLTYAYYANTNQLKRVDDISSSYTEDIDDQSGDNYAYDATGNLIEDVAEEIEIISWTLMGKIDSIGRTSTSTKAELKFYYDAMGNRVGKVVYDGSDTIKTWYFRDAQGNIMGTYVEQSDTLRWTEQHIYGSSRLGYWQPDSVMYPKPTLVTTDTTRYHLRHGDKRYEIVNHLGNVLSVITDRKIPKETGTPNGVADYYSADIFSAQDYYPFGMVMPSRIFNVGDYHYGYNTQEKVDEISGVGNHYTAEYWEYDSRTVRRWNQDPKPVEWESPYAANRNNPIWFEDPEGDFPFRRYEKGDEIKVRRWFKVVAVLKVVDFVEVKGRGVRIELEYKDKKTGLTDLRWIQTIRTNDPLGGGKPNEPYNDPNPSDDPPGLTKPFYYTDAEVAAKAHNPGETDFLDEPKRNAGKSKIVWKGELSVVGKDAATGKYESIKNLQYGFKLRRDGTVKAIKLRDRSVSKFQKQSIKSAK